MNILYLFADQLQAFTVGCMDNRAIHTPNLDALAADGVLFRNAYSDSPVCTPFRGCLMTGQYASQTGITGNGQSLPRGQRCLGHGLNDAGFATSYVGKWHLGGAGNVPVAREDRGGFTHFIGYQCYNSFIDNVCFFDEQGNERRFEQHRTRATTDLAIERLTAIQDQPFALFVSYQNPHYPIEPDPEFAALYARADLPVRENVDPATPPFTATASPRSPQPVERDPNFHRYGRSLAEFRRLYYALVTQLDYEIGRLIRTLKNRGLYENTLIIFTSDHGELMGSHGLMNKATPHEESARVPLIARAPGGLRGHVVDTPVSAGIDIWPTLNDFTGYAETASLSGHSWKAALLDEAPYQRPPVFAEHPWITGPLRGRSWVLVREGDWKLTADKQTLAPLSLHHLGDDPCELHNLLDTAAPEIRQRLQHLLEQWRERACDPS